MPQTALSFAPAAVIPRGKAFVLRELTRFLDGIPLDSPLFGPLTPNFIRMPKYNGDKRVKTWNRSIAMWSDKITNDVRCKEDCWLVQLGSDACNNYPKISFDGKGAANNFSLHQVLYALAHNGDNNSGTRVRNNDFELAHLCHRGRGNKAEDNCCVNPHHLQYIDANVNKDQNRCIYGARYLCPHVDLGCACLFTSANGRFLPCLNTPVPRICECTTPCKHELRIVV